MNVRRAIATDAGYVLATWMRSLNTSRECRNLSPLKFGKTYGKLVDRYLDHPSVSVWVAERDNRLIGWLAATPAVPIVHYVYVRNEHRRQGVAKAMLRAAGIERNQTIGATFVGPSSDWIRRVASVVTVDREEFLR